MIDSVPDLRRYLRPQDFVWLVLFATLIAFSPERSLIVIALLIAIGAGLLVPSWVVG